MKCYLKHLSCKTYYYILVVITLTLTIFSAACTSAKGLPQPEPKNSPVAAKSSPLPVAAIDNSTANDKPNSPGATPDPKQAAHYNDLHIGFDAGRAYATLLYLHAPQRNQYYQTLDHRTKSNLWILHLTSFELERGNSLNEVQVEFINELKSLSAGIDPSTNKETISAKLYQQKARAAEIFGEKDARRLLPDFAKPVPVQTAENRTK